MPQTPTETAKWEAGLQECRTCRLAQVQAIRTSTQEVATTARVVVALGVEAEVQADRVAEAAVPTPRARESAISTST